MAGVDVLEWEASVRALHVSPPCFPALSSSARISRMLSLSLSPTHLDTVAGCQMCVLFVGVFEV